MNNTQFRFQELEIWKRAAEFSVDFANFLNTARRSTFEVANILFLLSKNGYISGPDVKKIIGELEEESRMIFALIRTLRSESKN